MSVLSPYIFGSFDITFSLIVDLDRRADDKEMTLRRRMLKRGNSLLWQQARYEGCIINLPCILSWLFSWIENIV
jgi:hypothetical protein